MMLALPTLLLTLATALAIVHGQSPGKITPWPSSLNYMKIVFFHPWFLIACYSSLDCHGDVLNVVVPEKADASVFSSECCSAAVRGLSYQSQDGGAGCQNCYSEPL